MGFVKNVLCPMLQGPSKRESYKKHIYRTSGEAVWGPIT